MKRPGSLRPHAAGAALVCLPALFFTATPQSTGAGSGLSKGMRLVYASEGSEQPPWVVDSIDTKASWQGERLCSYIRFGATDVRRHCLRADTLFNWNETQQRLVAARPVGPHMSLRVNAARGGHSVFQTDSTVRASFSGQTFAVLPTTVTTFDSNGAPIRRLRENYVLALATALDGTFEVPDSSAAGRWTVQRRFALIRIEKD
jgi:hypothetical protein